MSSWVSLDSISHEGKLDEYKRSPARAMEILRTKDTGTLQYDTYLADLSAEVLATVSVVHGEVLGEPNAELRANLADGDVPVLFMPYQSM